MYYIFLLLVYGGRHQTKQPILQFNSKCLLDWFICLADDKVKHCYESTS